MDHDFSAAGEAANGEARPEDCHDGMPAIEQMKTLGARFVCWKNVPKPGKDGVTKIAKVPFTPDGSASGWTDPMKWGTFAECVAKAKAGGFNGIGMVFNGDGYVGIDIDGCRNPANGEIAEWARPRIRALDSYTEVSPSGTGVKIFLRSSSPPPFAKKARVVEGPGQTHEISGVNVQGVESGEEARCRPGPMHLRLADQSHCLLPR